jgi:hypothetical protein
MKSDPTYNYQFTKLSEKNNRNLKQETKDAIAPNQPTPGAETNMASLIIDGFKSAIVGVEQRIENLSNSIIQLANTPRSLTVQSNQPVDDLASIINDIAKNKMAASNL